MKVMKLILIVGFALALWSAQAATQYWDVNTAAGYQHGDGAWTTNAADANWGVSATAPRSTWTNGNAANFSGVSGYSRVMIASPITGNVVAIDGNGYTLVVTNGGRLTLTNYNSTHSLGTGANASSNSVMIIGGAGVTSIWEQTTALSKVTIGSAGNRQNSLVVDGAGFSGSAQFISADTVGVGYGYSQRVSVVNGGSFVCIGLNGANLGGWGNRISVSGGVGVVSTLNAGSVTIGSGTAGLGATNNVILVDGAGVADSALMTNVTTISIGAQPNDTSNGISIVNGGRLASSGVLNIGSVVGAMGNFVLVDHATFTNAANVVVGNASAASRNSLTVTNGARLIFSGGTASQVGGTGAFSNTMTVVGGAGVVSFVNAKDLTLMATASSLLVDGKGEPGSAIVSNSGLMTVCSAAASVSNTLVVTNGAQFYASGLTLGGGAFGQVSVSDSAFTLGTAGLTFSGPSNTLTVFDGGRLNVMGSSVLRCLSSYGTFRVSGEGSLFDGGGNGFGITYWVSGAGQFGNQLIVEDGAVLTNTIVRMHMQNSPAPVCSGNMFAIKNGGRFYNAGPFSFNANNPSPLMCNNTALVTGASSAWDNGGFAFATGGGSNHMIWLEAGLLTNVAALTMAAGNDNRLIVTNGARVFSSSGNIGTTSNNNNIALISSPDSLWNLGGGALSVGSDSANVSNNRVVIDRGGTVDAVGTLTLAGALNAVSLLGGTLGLAATTYTNGPFTAGEGVQAATLKSLGGGTLSFNGGLTINTNAVLAGAGTAGGGSAGIALLNGAVLAPGIGGPGALTIGGTGITFQAGSTYRCEITDLDLGPGAGWDLATVTGRVVLAGGAGAQTVKIDSRGAAPAHFDAGQNYNVRILTYGSQGGDTLAAMTLDATDFQAPGTWSLTNASSSLYLVYRGGGASATPNYTWNAPNRGHWSVDGNWQGGSAPAAGGGASLVLAFGDNGTPYYSTNDRAGNFLLNQMQFAGTSLTTNYIKGNTLVFTNAGARVDYQSAEGGAFVVSNTILSSGNLEIGGNAFAGTLTLAGAVTNMGAFTKKGAYTLVLAASNDFRGALVVDSVDGTLRLDNVNGLNGSGSVTLSNGMLAVNQGVNKYYFANNQHNRRGLVTGKGSTWYNWAPSTYNYQSGFSLGSTNVSFVIDGGSMLWSVRFHAFDAGAVNGLAIVTNGGVLGATNYQAFMAYSSTNCTTVITGTNSTLSIWNSMTVSDAAAAGNVLRLENGAMATNIASVIVANAGSSGNKLIVASGSKFYASSTLFVGSGVGTSSNAVHVTGTNSFFRIGGNIAYVASAGSSNNSFTVDNGALASIQRVYVSDSCTGNVLTVGSGGRLIHYTASDSGIGMNRGASSNAVVVTGPGSEWNPGGVRLMISSGNTSSWNRLTIADNGVVTNITTVSLADGIGSSDNSVIVNGGKLFAAGMAFGNSWSNSVSLDGSAQVVLTSMAVTNVNQRLVFNGGTLTVKNLVISNMAEFVAGDGTQTATLFLPTGATNVFGSGLAITNNAVLGGSGLIVATSVVYGALSPGLAGVGTLTNNGSFTLAGGASARFDVAANSSAGSGWDLLAVTNGTLSLGGTLKPVLKGGFLPARTDRFLVMTNQGGSVIASGGCVNGSRATIYAENLATRLGTFLIDIGAQGVVLTDYREWRPAGTLTILY